LLLGYKNILKLIIQFKKYNFVKIATAVFLFTKKFGHKVCKNAKVNLNKIVLISLNDGVYQPEFPAMLNNDVIPSRC